MVDGKKLVLESASDESGEDMLDLEDGPVSNSYIKTKNEIEPDQAEKTGPKYMVLDDLDEIKPFGKVAQYIPEGSGMVLVMPEDPQSIFDLDNVACLEGKEVIGFISDIVGPV